MSEEYGQSVAGVPEERQGKNNTQGILEDWHRIARKVLEEYQRSTSTRRAPEK